MRIAAVAVTVPAHQEAMRIGRCARSVGAALAPLKAAGVPVVCVVALDACADQTGVRAEEALPGVRCVALDARRVGAARSAATATALELLAGHAPERIWLASTDADSTVPANWLLTHLEHAEKGADAVAGLVALGAGRSRGGWTAARFRQYLAATGDGPGHPHVHGANLGMTAAAYLAAGGWPDQEAHEDVALWRALGSSGAVRHAIAGAPVTTSGRRDGRAPAGFAGFLDHLDRAPGRNVGRRQDPGARDAA